MSEPESLETVRTIDAVQEVDAKASFGFWVYLMTDCVLFAGLFAVYAVLHNNTFGGQTGAQLFSLPYVLIETLILLTSSFASGLGTLAARRGDVTRVLSWFSVTFILGASFVAMELSEFHHLVQTGNSWRRSGFLSSYFTLVGTHGLHVSIGLLWMATLLIGVASHGLTPSRVRKLTLLSTFWHFLDLIWIFIFTIVYLLGAIQR
jgi:cytochrome o ubiquinol oxidase subunit III